MTISAQPNEPWTRTEKNVIAISGSSGLIGSAVVRSLEGIGHDVRRLVRRAPAAPNEIAWDPARQTIDAPRLEGVDAVIHLAGENLAQRWTSDVKRRIRDSRTESTALLARTLASLSAKPRVLLSGSAIGIYGNRGDETLDESSAPGSDFLASVCVAWEDAAKPASDAGIRVVTLRTGLVLSPRGGVLGKLLPVFKLGAGGKLGSGRQWMSWIALADYVDAVVALLHDDAAGGPFNLVSPSPVTNAEFTRVLARVLSRPSLFTVPRFALELAMGEMADEALLASQRVRPRKLLELAFTFPHPTLESALRACIAPNRA